MAGAVSAAYVAAVVAAVAGAAMQYKASTDASKRVADETRMSLQRQKQLQQEAEAKALDTAKEFDTPKRQEQQDQLAEEITTNLMQPVSESQTIRAGQAETQGEVSGDYTAAKAASDAATMKQAQELARLLGKSTSASRLRLNEGIKLMDTGQGIDQLASFGRGNSGADQIAIQQAGQVDPGLTFAGQAMQALGTSYLMSGAGSSGMSGGNAAKGLSTSAAGQTGLTLGSSGTGLKAGTGLTEWFAK